MASENVNFQTTASSEQTEQPCCSTSQQESNNKDANSTKKESNLERICRRKQRMYSWPQEKKLLKLANYSACHAQECECEGSENAQSIIRSPEGNTQQSIRKFSDPCESCTHRLENHIEHLRVQSDEEINRLFGMAIDSDNIYRCMNKEVDTDAKNAYYQLYKLLRNCILSMTKPAVEWPLGQPPFESPTIAKAIMNFVGYKFSDLSTTERQVTYKMVNLLFYCLKYWNFEAPSDGRLTINADEASYKINYTRWLVFCHVPEFCDSLPHHDISLVFGKTLLRAVFRSVCKQLKDQCNNQRDKIRVLPEISGFPEFLSSLEVEIYSDSSPIWDPEFKLPPPSHFQIALESKGHQARKTGEFEKITFTPNKKGNFTTTNINPGIKKIQEKRPNAEGRLDAKRRKNEETLGDLPDETISEIGELLFTKCDDGQIIRKRRRWVDGEEEAIMMETTQSPNQADWRNRKSVEEEQQLIKEIHKRPALWNFNLPFVERSLRAEKRLWEEIFTSMNGTMDIASMKEKWKSLCYIFRIHNRQHQPSGSARTRRKGSWVHFERMQFLCDVQRENETVTNIPALDSQEESNDADRIIYDGGNSSRNGRGSM